MTKKKIKIGRNDPCPCGSVKKYKKCCGSSLTSPVGIARQHSLHAQPFTVHKLTPAQQGEHRAPPFVIEKIEPDQVPAKVMKRLLDQQRQEQERTKRFGLVKPEIAADFHGYKFVAIGNKLLYRPAEKTKFFADVLLAYVPLLFGREWFEKEVAKPPEERHPVMQWRVKGMNFMSKQPPLPDGTYTGTPTGPLQAYMTFAYDLYIVEHNARLDYRLLERLKQGDQYQGARHELFAEATCLRAGFAVTHEDETDLSRRHAEFTATHRASGQKLSVEAKSKHRPGVLGQAGTRQASNALNLRIGKLLNDAVAKKPPHPLAVFLDMNMPFEASNRLLSTRPPHKLILRTLAKLRNENGGKDPINLVVFTNHPQHYTKDEEIAQQAHLLSVISQVPIRAARQEALWAVTQAANLYGNIPEELTPTIAADQN